VSQPDIMSDEGFVSSRPIEPVTMSTQSIPDMPYHKYAELLGLKGIFVDDPDKVGRAWDEALASDRPVENPYVARQRAPLRGERWPASD
jgi:thiamine pyrophosphate-dependent acetolactate synthase large subunit-like protein